TPAAESREIAIPQLVLDASTPGTPATVLPLRLSKDFDLDFEVVAHAAELSRIEVLGQPLGPEPLIPLFLPAPPRPHRVSIRRRDGVLTVALDGGSAVARAGTSTEDWLAARGLPKRKIVLQAIRLTR